jgi:hypothetical protein
MGTGASVDVWADRSADVSVTTDADGLIGLTSADAENGRFVNEAGGTIGIDLSAGGSGDGLNPDARTVIDDIFRIRNQAGTDQVVWIKDVQDDGGLFGDEGPLHFFRGPVQLKKGALRADRRIFSQLDPVPGTPADEQRLTITGLVPPAANIGTEPSDAQRQAWINAGHPVTVDATKFSDAERRAPGDAAAELDGVTNDPDVVVGRSRGRYVLEPGEEMKVGLAGDFSGVADDEAFDLGSVLDSIQVVGRSLEDARQLAVGSTEFNTG